MCGRFTLTGGLIWLIRLLNLPEIQNFTPRYNIAPSQPVLVFLYDPDLCAVRYDFHLWGLIPSFCKDPTLHKPMINARSETINEKPSFKKAFQYRRCIIPASGFYEWQKCKDGKQPWYFRRRDEEQIFYFAGLWDIWHGPDGEQVNSCAVITTWANQLVDKIHPRMPVILNPDSLTSWLNPEADPGELKKLLRPFPATEMTAWKVDRRMNNPRFDNASCLDKPSVYQPELF